VRWLVLLIAVAAPATIAAAPDRRTDEHSYAEPAKVRITNLALDLRVDFAARRLAGTATLDLAIAQPTDKLVLDTRDLAIDKVEGHGEHAVWVPLKFTVGARDAILGSPLAITLDKAYPKVRVTYRTQPQASGLQWLPAALTATGKQPFMFTQSQAIHARSWVPLQDTPGVRFTYRAHITTPKEVVAVMSADNDPAVVRDGDYTFQMPQPIPSYLLALAVGDLAFKPLSPRSGVWAEPGVVERAAAEFADTEAMIRATEQLYGPYRWGRYDLLILPASFPFGGMENPRLSFITPTVIVGDRSLVSLIAHELAHSWSGNLVTNASWKDMWLNEGFTSYVENRIVERVYGTEHAEIELVLAQRGLRARLAELPRDHTRLRIPSLVGLDPDESSDAVAYDKGQWFLKTLEQRFGRPTFDAFLRTWFERHAFHSVTTEDFVAFLRTELIAKQPKALSEAEMLDWIDGMGLPRTAVDATSKRLAAVDAARTAWLAGRALPAAKWTTQEMVAFLEGLPARLTRAQLIALDKRFALTGTANAEVAQRWYPLTIRSGYAETRPALAAFVDRIGRRKLVEPIYRALVATPDGLAFAKQTFAHARPNYHPITIASIEELIAGASKRR
jgi:leukotriene-A4 hydrolase